MSKNVVKYYMATYTNYVPIKPVTGVSLYKQVNSNWYILSNLKWYKIIPNHAKEISKEKFIEEYEKQCLKFL